MINLIGATKTSTGLEVYARLDDGEYPAKIRVTDSELNVSTSTVTSSTRNGTTASNHDLNYEQVLIVRSCPVATGRPRPRRAAGGI
jgi:hypothetical protein